MFPCRSRLNSWKKTEFYLDKKSGKEKRRSPVTKNEHLRKMIRQAVKNQIRFRYVLTDIWFASADNMICIKDELDKEFIMALKSNRKIALSLEDKANGHYHKISELGLPEGEPIEIYLEKVPFPLLLVLQIFTNGDGSIGARYLVSSDLALDGDKFNTIFKKRWKVEEYHRSLKQNSALAKSPTRTEKTQTNHFVAALWSFVKFEMLKVETKKNHYQLKNRLYMSALRMALEELRRLRPISLETISCI